MTQMILSVSTLEVNEIEVVHVYTYPGVLIDDSLTFTLHVEKLVKKLRLKWGFHFSKQVMFFF